jgi:hypothetical protein
VADGPLFGFYISYNIVRVHLALIIHNFWLELHIGFVVFCGLESETHTKRLVTQHGCLPSCLGDGDKGIEIVNGKEKNILYLAD